MRSFPDTAVLPLGLIGPVCAGAPTKAQRDATTHPASVPVLTVTSLPDLSAPLPSQYITRLSTGIAYRYQVESGDVLIPARSNLYASSTSSARGNDSSNPPTSLNAATGTERLPV